jgi:hypothetical protein
MSAAARQLSTERLRMSASAFDTDNGAAATVDDGAQPRPRRTQPVEQLRPRKPVRLQSGGGAGGAASNDERTNGQASTAASSATSSANRAI